MKRFFAALLALFSSVTFGTTLVPVQLLNPTGSTTGQTIVSTGASSAPGWATVPLSGLSSVAANTVIANATSASAAPTAFSMPSCSGAANVLQWTTSSGFTCGTGVTGRLLAVQVFSSSGTYTPTSGPTKTIVTVQAPGGGSGGAATTTSAQTSFGEAGAGGSYAQALWTSPTSQTVTIGAVGTAGASGGAGGAGGTTSVGSVVSCPGGTAGTAGTTFSTVPAIIGPVAGPAACTVSGATTLVSIPGGRGPIQVALSTGVGVNQFGGASAMGFGTFGAGGNSGVGGAGSFNAASSSAGAGFTGGAAIVIFYDYQ